MQRSIPLQIVLAIFSATVQFSFAQGALDCSKAIEIVCGTSTIDNTQGSPSHVSTYGSIGWNESGPEDIFVLHVQEPTRLIVTLSSISINLDVFILESCDASKVLAYGDRKAAYTNAVPGTYYVVVDGRDNASGSYRLTVQCETGYPPAGTILWSEGFENEPDRDWHADYGIWEMGVPLSGPNSAYVGKNCAATKLAGDYPDNIGGTRLIRHTSFLVPDSTLKPRLRFWHWHYFNCGDYGRVQIKVEGKDTWEDLPETTLSGHSSGVWSYRTCSLSRYAGKTVQIAFFFHSEDCWPGGWETASGWYIDNVAVVIGDEKVNFTENWDSFGLGNWNVAFGTWEVGAPTTGPGYAYSQPLCLATVLDGTYGDNIESWVTSPPFRVPSASKQPSLRFRHWYSFNCGDWGQIRIYANKTWRNLDSYSGGSSGWTYPFLNLSAYADSTVMLRFVFHSEDCWPGGWETDYGWYIDDIEINGFSDPCSYKIFPAQLHVPASGNTDNVHVMAGAGCAWTAKSNDTWITILSGASGSGNGTVTFKIEANPDGPRTGTISIAQQVLTITQDGAGPTARTVSVMDLIGLPGGMVRVPIKLTAQGDENAIGFSLKYDPAILKDPTVTAGKDAAAATLNFNSNLKAQGLYGIALSLPAGQEFSAGEREVVVVNFTIAAATTDSVAIIEFSDQPVAREIVDLNAQTLPAGWASGKITLSCGLEGDVAPRPDGNRAVSIIDWVQIGRFAAGLDQAVEGCEFQKAECAPKPCGDGRIGISDWVQTGRYAAGLDPAMPACGPAKPTRLAAAAPQNNLPKGMSTRTVRIVNPRIHPGQMHNITIELEAQGDENALGFSLQFDPSVLSYQSTNLGPDAAGGALNVNDTKQDSGRLGFALALQANQAFQAGNRKLILVNFSVHPNAGTAQTPVEFTDVPITREIVDKNANLLMAEWTAVTVVRAALAELPLTYGLGQNFPNPFNPETAILYELPQTSQVEVAIFNLLGERIRTLVNERQAAGQHRLHWDGRNEFGRQVPSGVYLYRLRAGEFVQTRKMILMQ